MPDLDPEYLAAIEVENRRRMKEAQDQAERGRKREPQPTRDLVQIKQRQDAIYAECVTRLAAIERGRIEPTAR